MPNISPKNFKNVSIIMILFILLSIALFFKTSYFKKMFNSNIITTSTDVLDTNISVISDLHVFKKNHSFHHNYPILNFSNSHKFKKHLEFTFITKIAFSLAFLIILSIILSFIFF